MWEDECGGRVVEEKVVPLDRGADRARHRSSTHLRPLGPRIGLYRLADFVVTDRHPARLPIRLVHAQSALTVSTPITGFGRYVSATPDEGTTDQRLGKRRVNKRIQMRELATPWASSSSSRTDGRFCRFSHIST